MGISNGGAPPDSVLGVGGFEFDDAIPQAPPRPIYFVGTHSMASPALAVATVRLEVWWGTGDPCSAAGECSGFDQLPWSFSSLVEVRAMRAMIATAIGGEGGSICVEVYLSI